MRSDGKGPTRAAARFRRAAAPPARRVLFPSDRDSSPGQPFSAPCLLMPQGMVRFVNHLGMGGGAPPTGRAARRNGCSRRYEPPSAIHPATSDTVSPARPEMSKRMAAGVPPAGRLGLQGEAIHARLANFAILKLTRGLDVI